MQKFIPILIITMIMVITRTANAKIPIEEQWTIEKIKSFIQNNDGLSESFPDLEIIDPSTLSDSKSNAIGVLVM